MRANSPFRARSSFVLGRNVDSVFVLKLRCKVGSTNAACRHTLAIGFRVCQDPVHCDRRLVVLGTGSFF
jgi:hypothetical protein